MSFESQSLKKSLQILLSPLTFNRYSQVPFPSLVSQSKSQTNEVCIPFPWNQYLESILFPFSFIGFLYIFSFLSKGNALAVQTQSRCDETPAHPLPQTASDQPGIAKRPPKALSACTGLHCHVGVHLQNHVFVLIKE